jgi:hypothetical protein
MIVGGAIGSPRNALVRHNSQAIWVQRLAVILAVVDIRLPSPESSSVYQTPERKNNAYEK